MNITLKFSSVILIIIILTIGNDNAASAYNVTAEKQYKTKYADSYLLPILLASLSVQKHTPKTSKVFDDEYDFIIVGSGAGGSTVASRLSEIDNIRILMLEAGKSPPLLTDLPATAEQFYGSDIDWNFKIESQKNSLFGQKDNKLVFPTGKAVGGTTLLNAMLAVRGNRLDYEEWKEMGADGWGYYDVLPYFKRLEDNKVFNDPVYHGRNGPITIEEPAFKLPLLHSVFEASTELGYKYGDSNGEDQNGFFHIQSTIRRSQRCSAAKGYLVPLDDKPNLDIVSEAFVKKVVIEDGRATGVIFDFDGEEHQVNAKREVILSAGTVNSAKLLMLSGVGPREHLEEMNIPVIADLPVGQNFHDHVATPMVFELDENFPTYVNNLTQRKYIDQYVGSKQGPLTIQANIAAVAFLQNGEQQIPGKINNYQLYIIESNVSTFKSLNLKKEVYEEMFSEYENKKVYRCSPHSLQPKSRGCVKLRSKDPFDDPIIDPRYYENQDDVADAVEGYKTCFKIASTRAMQKIGAKPTRKLPPECKKYVFESDEGLRCYALSFGITLSHLVGTAKMGRVDDPTTVVDPKLRVKGINGLRVVDASIMPKIPSGNTQIPTMMIGEKASDIIKQDMASN